MRPLILRRRIVRRQRSISGRGRGACSTWCRRCCLLGVGIGRVTANLEGSPIDDAVRIEDDEIVRTGYQLLYREGLFLGGTSGVNVAAAVRVARELGRGNTVVTILCDGGHKYLSRFWSRDYLEQKGLAAHADAARRTATS